MVGGLGVFKATSCCLDGQCGEASVLSVRSVIVLKCFRNGRGEPPSSNAFGSMGFCCWANTINGVRDRPSGPDEYSPYPGDADAGSSVGKGGSSSALPRSVLAQILNRHEKVE